MQRWIILVAAAAVVSGLGAPTHASAACPWGYPIGDAEGSPAPTADNHPVGGMNLPQYGSHLGADFWSGGGCTDLGRTVYAVADGQIVEIVDALGSYLDVVVVRHEDDAAGTVYAMYGHIARDDGLAEGDMVAYRQPLGTIADVLAYFSPCHLHFELLNEAAYANGPFCNGCANAGYHVSPGYDQQVGVTAGVAPSGDAYLEVDDAIAGNWWYLVDEFIAARVGQACAPCPTIPPDGATLDESGACFSYGGSPEYWYVQNDAGHGGTLRWTHTTDSAMVDNHGEWSLVFEEAGDYLVEVWIEDAYGHSTMAAYQLAHAGGGETIVVDQEAASGWAALGTFAFAAGEEQSLRLDDNTGEPYASMIALTFDAVRVTRQGVSADESGGDGSESGSGSASASGSASGSGSGEASGRDGDGSGFETGTPGTGGSGDDGPSLPPGASRPGGADGCACGVTSAAADGAFAMIVLVAISRRRRRATC